MHEIMNRRMASLGWTERVEFALWLFPLAIASGLLTLLMMEMSNRFMPRPHASWEILPVLILPSVLVGLVGYLRVIRRSDPLRDLREALWQRPVLLYLSIVLFGLLTLLFSSVPGPAVTAPLVVLPGLTGIGGVVAVFADVFVLHRHGEVARRKLAQRIRTGHDGTEN